MNEENSIRRNCFLNTLLIRTRILKLTNLRKELKKRLKNVKNFRIKYYVKRYNFQFYKIENRVLLSFKNIIFNRFSKKLNSKFYESWETTSFVKKMTYRLILLKTFQSRNIHDVFHILLLESYIDRLDIDLKLLVIEIKKIKQ